MCLISKSIYSQGSKYSCRIIAKFKSTENAEVTNITRPAHPVQLLAAQSVRQITGSPSSRYFVRLTHKYHRHNLRARTVHILHIIPPPPPASSTGSHLIVFDRSSGRPPASIGAVRCRLSHSPSAEHNVCDAAAINCNCNCISARCLLRSDDQIQAGLITITEQACKAVLRANTHTQTQSDTCARFIGRRVRSPKHLHIALPGQ